MGSHKGTALAGTPVTLCGPSSDWRVREANFLLTSANTAQKNKI